MNQLPHHRWLHLATAALVFFLSFPTQAAPTPRAAFLQSVAQQPDVLYTLPLPDGKSAVVYKDGIAKVYSADFKTVETRMIVGLVGQTRNSLEAPTKAQVLFELSKPSPRPYASNKVLVVYRNGISGSRDLVNVSAGKLTALRQIRSLSGTIAASQAPKYTTSASMNVLLARLGVDRSTRLFRGIGKSRLQAMSERASVMNGRAMLDIGNAYELHITGASVQKAVTALRRSGQVAYASPAFYVTTMHTHPIPISQPAAASARSLTSAMGTAGAGSHLPSNYGLRSSLQSMFNAPGLNAAAAYDEIVRRFGQLPGQGTIITNVSLGDLTGADTIANPNDDCNFYARAFGPTTIVQGGQRYLDWPSMPLIPTWTADASGNLDGLGEVCKVGPQLIEVGLDFSVMTPLPHDRQRPDAVGEGARDLLGIAPGADYRLVVPASAAPTSADIDAALLAAALQSPRPDVITASVGFGEDQYGFSGRYLGDDPLSAAVIGAIVSNYHIVVTISSNDGLRSGSNNAAVSPSGGSAPTNVSHGNPTDLNDIYLSTVPSRDPDTGAIAVGGTTLDDIFAAPPHDPANAPLKAQHAFAETRWTGFTSFSSGFGSRVNVSAPADNIAAFMHTRRGAANEVDVILNGGTSASAPEVAASAAVLLQVARLTGQPFSDPRAVRDFLIQTGTPVPKVPQSDVHNHIGPQVNLGRAVETLLARAGNPVTPQVTNVAVEQRRDKSGDDTAFQSDADPAMIDLSGANLKAWITIAPDWEGLPADTSYTLRVEPAPSSGTGASAVGIAPAAGTAGGVLATTAWARVLPREIFAAAGVPLASDSPRSFRFTYTAMPTGGSAQPLAAEFTLTFGPSQEHSAKILAPVVQSVVRGSVITVHYDLRNTGVSNATLEVSIPGRVTPFTGKFYHVAYSTPIGGGQGTVDVPVSALDGGGIYGVAINIGDGHYSDFAFTRVQPQASSVRPPAPLLSANGSKPGHLLEIPYGGDFTISWDASRVPGATGAILEVSAAGPNAAGSYNTFNNPNGSERDDPNGPDTGSLYYMYLSGASGTMTLQGSHMVHVLRPTLYENLRVLPVSGGTVVGEASEVSTITMDGVVASDGGAIMQLFQFGGWGINGHGADGFITSFQRTASGQLLSSLETFDQTTNAITQVIASKVNHAFVAPAWGVWGEDLGLFGDYDFATGETSYNTLDPVANGTVGSAWTPPDLDPSLLTGAINQSSTKGLFLALAPGTAPMPERWRVFTSDIPANTFSPLYDVSAPLAGMKYGDYELIAQNTHTNTGLLVGQDIYANSNPPTLVTMNLDNGEIGRVFQGIGSGSPSGIALDSQTNKAAVTTFSSRSFGIYDLSSGEVTVATLPGLNALYGPGWVAADPEHHYFLVLQVKAPHAAGSIYTINNNSLSRIYVMDEQGNILKSLERFNLYNIGLQVNQTGLQVNPSLGLGYLEASKGDQLAPFRYMNDVPLASDGTLATDENKSASGVLEASSPGSSPLIFSIVDQPKHGEVTLDDATTGAYTYTPDEDYYGDDRFTFKASDGEADSNVATVGITVNSTNHSPTASDGSLTTDENEPASGTLKASDPDGGPLTFSIVDQPQHGSVTLDDAASGAYTYAPVSDYSGSDSFTFKVSDGQADSNTATIKITVNAVEPPPPPHKDDGGGALGWLVLAALLGLGPFVRLRRRHTR